MRGPLHLATFVLASFGLAYGISWLANGVVAGPKPDKQQSTDARVTPAAASVGAVGQTTSEERLKKVYAFFKKADALSESHAAYEALRQLTAQDFAAATADSPAMLERFSKAPGEMIEAWFDRWLEIDSTGALRFFESSDFLKQLTAKSWGRFPRQRSHFTAGVTFQALARRAPEWLKQHVAQLEPGPAAELGVYSLLAELAENDLHRASELAATFANGPNRAAATSGLVKGMASHDPSRALTLALVEDAAPLRQELLDIVSMAAAERGLGTVRQLLEEVPDSAMRRQMAIDSLNALVFGRAAFQQPNGLLEWVKGELERDRTSAGELPSLRDWSSPLSLAAFGEETRAAVDWAANLSGDSDGVIFKSVTERWASKQPEQLRQWLTEHGSSLNAAVLKHTSELVSILARRDREGTEKWASSLPACALRDRAQFSLAMSAAAAGDLARANAAYQTIAAADSEGALAAQFAKALVKRDGAAAAEWAMELPAGAARKAAITHVAQEWTQREPGATGEWIRAMPPGAERDEALSRFTPMIALGDPSVAARWVSEISSPIVRENAAGATYALWSWENPVAARAWVRSLPDVSAKWRSEVLRRP